MFDCLWRKKVKEGADAGLLPTFYLPKVLYDLKN